jgi:hypothetical protein
MAYGTPHYHEQHHDACMWTSCQHKEHKRNLPSVPVAAEMAHMLKNFAGVCLPVLKL